MQKMYALFMVVSCILLTGCSSENHPNYSLFKNVPADHLAKVKSEIEKAGIQNFELPTKFPYPVTNANTFNNGELPNQVDIFLGDSKHVLHVGATKAPKDAVVDPSSVVMQDESETKLSDGTNALYGNSGDVSQLAWDKNGVFYQLDSSKAQNKSDLTENQLIEVANSFN